MKVASECDVHNLTIPLFLLPDDSYSSYSSTKPGQSGLNSGSETPPALFPSYVKQFSESNLIRRAEVILKNTKGLLLEHSRSTRHGIYNKGIDRNGRSIHFLIPSETPEIERIFSVARERLVEIFRLIKE